MRIVVNERDSSTFVICPVCKNKLTRIVHWHIKRHGYTVKEFEAKFEITATDRICVALRNKLGVTKERLIKKYGLMEGERRWESYRNKQALTNTFEYKNKKYGWTKDQFNQYNHSRASTLKNFIKRHGDEVGRVKWEEYRQIQAYTGCHIDYFIEKYGEKEGKNKWEAICQQKRIVKGNFIRKYGETLGQQKWDLYLEKRKQPSSEIAKKFFTELYKLIPSTATDNIFFLPMTPEYFLSKENNFYIVDFYDKSVNRIIEFYGDYWHANPKTYSSDWVNPTTKSLAKDIWRADLNRKHTIETIFNKEILIIWEMDARLNQNEQINLCLKFLGYGKQL